MKQPLTHALIQW